MLENYADTHDTNLPGDLPMLKAPRSTLGQQIIQNVIHISSNSVKFLSPVEETIH